MLGHLSFGVSDLVQSGQFYDAVFGSIGVVRLWGSDNGYGYGFPGGNDRFAIFPQEGGDLAAGPGFHLAFHADTRVAVDAFYAAAMKNGGSDEGSPGIREHYGPTYYAAFVRDPDGHKLEVVCQKTQTELA